jgi:hypothetical protein
MRFKLSRVARECSARWGKRWGLNSLALTW